MRLTPKTNRCRFAGGQGRGGFGDRLADLVQADSAQWRLFASPSALPKAERRCGLASCWAAVRLGSAWQARTATENAAMRRSLRRNLCRWCALAGCGNSTQTGPCASGKPMGDFGFRPVDNQDNILLVNEYYISHRFGVSSELWPRRTTAFGQGADRLCMRRSGTWRRYLAQSRNAVVTVQMRHVCGAAQQSQFKFFQKKP